MYQKRQVASRKIPIERKGTKYVARASGHNKSGVSVVIAVRDMLGLARTEKEVKIMIGNKMLKINGKEVKKKNEAVRLLNILEAGDKKYVLSLLPTGRFSLTETKDNERICKVVGKTMLRKGGMQLNLHDGTNVISKDKVSVGDSVLLDMEGKMKKVLPIEKGKEVFVYSGKSAGKSGKIESVEGRKVKIKLEDRSVELDQAHVIVR